MINLHSYVSHTHKHFTYFFTYSRVHIVHAPLEAGAAGPCTAGLCPALGGSSLGPAPCEAVAVAGHSHATPPGSL